MFMIMLFICLNDVLISGIKMRKKIISIDLDGVLNKYEGNYKKNKLSPIKEGAYSFLEKLSKDFIIEIYTVREKNLCKKWLKDNNLSQFVSDVRNVKNPKTSVFLDDRAITFDGDFEKAYNKIISFQPHWNTQK